MSLVIALLLALLVLDRPWNIVVIVAAVLLEAFEISIWLRWRRVRSITGAEGIVGSTGVATTDCKPSGQIRLRGQFWHVECTAGVNAGDEVRVTGVHGLRLLVEPALNPEMRSVANQ